MPPFLTTRWKGETPLETVFWRDMLVVGTVVNLASTAAALALLVGGYPVWLGLTVELLPIPWNTFLLLAVWKAAEREGGPSATTANVVGALWFFVMLAL